MDPELELFVKVWLTAVGSLVYCRQIAGRIPGGPARLLAVLPAVYLFIALPFQLSVVVLGAPTVFYLGWLANFKLLLFAFGAGRLAAEPPLSLVEFVAVGLLPVQKSKGAESSPGNRFRLVLESVALAAILWLSSYREFIHPNVMLILYGGTIGLCLDLMFAVTSVAVRAAVGMELEPQFDRPYLATSLQDFWGRRWNLIVTGILRPSVYLPVRRFTAPYAGEKLALAAAILATFAVSGLMHEFIFFYLTSRATPTWEVTCFFLLHGFCVVLEDQMKRGGVRRLPVGASRISTLGFVGMTGAWLFFPQLINYGVALKGIEECLTAIAYVRDRMMVM
ncbi:hypothetical protein M569_05960, partial [Genlisea aurea]